MLELQTRNSLSPTRAGPIAQLQEKSTLLRGGDRVPTRQPATPSQWQAVTSPNSCSFAFPSFFPISLSLSPLCFFRPSRLVAFIDVSSSKMFFNYKGFSKIFVGLLESVYLWVVILARVRLPTLGSPHTPCKRDHTGRCCCCCCCLSIVFLSPQ